MKKMIAIAGVGALGSHAVQFLRNSDAAIRVIDFDRVEQRNTGSQFHARSAVGRSKVVALQQSMQFLFGTRLDAVPHRLAADNVSQLLSGADLVIDCLDNAEARRLVQEYARARQLALLHGALAAEGGFGRVIWDEEFQIDAEPSEGVATCENGEHLPFIALTAAWLAWAAQQYLASGRKLGFQIHPGGALRT